MKSQVEMKPQLQTEQHVDLGASHESKIDSEVRSNEVIYWNNDNERELKQDLEEISSILEILEQKQFLSQNDELNNNENDQRSAILAYDNSTLPNKDNYPSPYTGCDMKFVNDESQIAHYRSHRQGQFVPCGICGKIYQSIDHLITHIRIHERGDKPFECPTCGKRFSRKSNLKRHLYLHQEEKPFHCPYCLKGFSGKFNLKRHTKSCINSCKHS